MHISKTFSYSWVTLTNKIDINIEKQKLQTESKHYLEPCMQAFQIIAGQHWKFYQKENIAYQKVIFYSNTLQNIFITFYLKVYICKASEYSFNFFFFFLVNEYSFNLIR